MEMCRSIRLQISAVPGRVWKGIVLRTQGDIQHPTSPPPRGREDSLLLQSLQLDLAVTVERMIQHDQCELELLSQNPRQPNSQQLLEILVEGGTLRLTICNHLLALAVATIHEASLDYQRGRISIEGCCATISEQVGFLTSLAHDRSDYFNGSSEDNPQSMFLAVLRFEAIFDELALDSIVPSKSIREWLIHSAQNLAEKLMPHSVAVERIESSHQLRGTVNEMVEHEFIHPQNQIDGSAWDDQFDLRLSANQPVVSSIEFSVIPDGDAYWIGCLRNVIMDWLDGHSTLEQLIERSHHHASRMQSPSESWYHEHHQDLAQLKLLSSENDLYLTRDQMLDFRMDRQLNRISDVLDRRWRSLHRVTTRWWWSTRDISPSNE